MKPLIICLSIFLVSCKTEFPAIAPQERCFVVFGEAVDDGEKKYYSGHCRCHLYEWTSSHIGRITESVNKDILYCDKLGGFRPDELGAVYTWQESIRLWLKRMSKNK